MKTEDISILVVDDEDKIREVVQSYLESKGYKVLTAADGTTALTTFAEEDISLLLLDLMLPDISGEEVCMTIRQTSRVPIIMLTAKVEEEDMLRGLNIGADDYITKPFSLKTLEARVRAVLRRTKKESPLYHEMSFGSGDLVINRERRQVLKQGKDAKLTPHEYDLLSTFIGNPTKIFTREELIVTTFGYDYDGYDRTIDSHIRNIRSKIEDDTRNPVYIQTVHGVGYTFGGESLEEKP